jgi:hypothetical protein
MTKRGIHLFLVFVCITAFAACTQQRTPCYEPKIVSVSIGTYRIADTVAVDTALPDPRFYCLDTIIDQTITSKNKFAALLSPFADSTRWILVTAFDDTTGGAIPDPVEAYDTITFYHDRKLNFISNACGYVFYYDLADVKTTYNSIDSIVLLNKSVDNNANAEHVKIFY